MRHPLLALLAVSLVTALACAESPGEGKKGGGGDDTVNETLSWATGDGTAESPDFIVAGAGGTLSHWAEGSTGLRETRFVADDGLADVRVFADPSSGELRAVLDELTGRTTLVLQDDADAPSRYFFLTYDADGDWVEGHVAFVEGNSFKLGKIAGQPAFSGQLTAQLTDDGSGESGSFAITALASSNIVTPQGDLALEGVVEIDEALLVLVEAGTAHEDGAGVNVSGIVPRALKAGAVVALGVGVVSSSGAWGAAAVAMAAGSVLSNTLADQIEEKFRTEDPESQEYVDFVVDTLRTEDSTKIGDRLRAAGDAVQEWIDGAEGSNKPSAKAADWIADDLDNYGGNESSSWSRLAGQAEAWLDDLGSRFGDDAMDSVPASPDDVGVEGLAVWQDATAFEIEGDVSSRGRVNLEGEDTEGRGYTITIEGSLEDGEFSGSFEIDTGAEGSAEGTVKDLGDCETSTGAGETGTFTFAHYVGVGPGEVSFFYDAYSVPDAFTVRGTEGVLFTTGGEVSGSDNVALDVGTQGAITLFVSVSAPDPGTAWEYSMGCLE